ncbi:MAG: metalloregulator ArsR/SmtB family transcription factor [Parvularculaceae bacterium]|nr:metalloregulator ArsR/SmtB family transcription factor [Parvularculaceae bacterium]
MTRRHEAALAALADPNRLRIVETLRRAPVRAGELADAVGLSPPALSRHLRALKKAGLVEETHPEFDARVRVYALKREGLEAIKSWVDETDRLWAKQLAAFKQKVESGR